MSNKNDLFEKDELSASQKSKIKQSKLALIAGLLVTFGIILLILSQEGKR